MQRRSPAIELQLPPGMRATRATRAMVALLRGRSGERFTAAETEAALARKGVVVNRVTVFRALDRLAQAGLLQRGVDADRITRYQWRIEAAAAASVSSAAIASPATERRPQWQAVFTCDQCSTVQPLDASAPAVGSALAQLAVALQPTGHTQSVQVHGVCAQCVTAA